MYAWYYVWFGHQRTLVAIAPSFAVEELDRAVLRAWGWVQDAYSGVQRGTWACLDVAIEREGPSGKVPLSARPLPDCAPGVQGPCC